MNLATMGLCSTQINRLQHYGIVQWTSLPRQERTYDDVIIGNIFLLWGGRSGEDHVKDNRYGIVVQFLRVEPSK